MNGHRFKSSIPVMTTKTGAGDAWWLPGKRDGGRLGLRS